MKLIKHILSIASFCFFMACITSCSNENEFVTDDLAFYNLRGHVRTLFIERDDRTINFDVKGHLLEYDGIRTQRNEAGNLTAIEEGEGAGFSRISFLGRRLDIFSGDDHWVKEFDENGYLKHITLYDSFKNTYNTDCEVLEIDDHGNWTEMKLSCKEDGIDLDSRTITYYTPEELKEAEEQEEMVESKKEGDFIIDGDNIKLETKAVVDGYKVSPEGGEIRFDVYHRALYTTKKIRVPDDEVWLIKDFETYITKDNGTKQKYNTQMYIYKNGGTNHTTNFIKDIMRKEQLFGGDEFCILIDLETAVDHIDSHYIEVKGEINFIRLKK